MQPFGVPMAGGMGAFRQTFFGPREVSKQPLAGRKGASDGRGRQDRRGLTLIEVLLVLAILVIIASLSVTAYGPIQRRAYIRAAEAQIQTLKQALERYRLDLNAFPTTQQGLDALCSPPPDLPNPAKWSGPYVERVPLDPWDRPYQYECPGRNNPDSFDLWSLGPDGQNGTDDDIGNWMVP